MIHLSCNSRKIAFLAAVIALVSLFVPLSAQGAAVNLTWNASPGSNIAGYRLFYGTASQTYVQSVDVGNSTTATLSSLSVGTLYFFAARAYTTLGIESNFSNEVAYTLPSQTPTPRPGPTSTPPWVNLSGNTSHCSNPVSDPVPNVTLTRTGTSTGSTVSDSSGVYQFLLQTGGTFTVTPTKSALAAGSSGINTYDVLAIRRHYLNLAPLTTSCLLTAANVNGDALINTTDILAVQKFFLGQTTGTANVGKYTFSPASRTYPSVSANQNGQNYDAIILGDVAASFADRPDTQPTGDGRVVVIEVALPDVAVDQTVTDFVVPVTTTDINIGAMLVGFQGDFTFDETVVNFQTEPVQNSGLTGGDWNVSANVLPGEGPIRTLRISAFSRDFTPLSGSGILFNLNMTRVGHTPGASTALTWVTGSDPFVFIDSNLDPDVPSETPSGHVILP